MSTMSIIPTQHNSWIRSQQSSEPPAHHTVHHETCTVGIWQPVRTFLTCAWGWSRRVLVARPISDRLQLRHTGLLSVLSVRTASPLSLFHCLSAVPRLRVLTVKHSHDPHVYDSAKNDEEHESKGSNLHFTLPEGNRDKFTIEKKTSPLTLLNFKATFLQTTSPESKFFV